MATVNMNCVEFYNPNPASKASHAQLTKLVSNKHRTPLQPSKFPLGNAELAPNVQDDDPLDDSLPSLDGLFQASRNRDIPQAPHQNYRPLHISKRQPIDESRLVTDPTTQNLVYVPGNTQSRLLSSLLYAHTPC
jgi:hypothetical protein